MILEFAENGDLFDYLITVQDPFSEEVAKALFL
jgi:hypothetical protein